MRAKGTTRRTDLPVRAAKSQRTGRSVVQVFVLLAHLLLWTIAAGHPRIVSADEKYSVVPPESEAVQPKTEEPSKKKNSPEKSAKPAPAEESKTLPWLASLVEGRRHALADRKPQLIRIGASWCPPCRKLDAEIEKPSVQAELGRWTLVFLDADKSEDEMRELNVTGVPALRIRTMLSEAVASRDGFLSAEELVTWLKKQYESAATEADEVLLSNDEPDAAGVVRLVQQFQQRDPLVRETAIRRLAAWPQKARLEVARAFVEGSLSRRLAALELLRVWRAPVAELDPWQPESFSKERIAALNLWAEKYQSPAAGEVKKLADDRRWPTPAATSIAC